MLCRSLPRVAAALVLGLGLSGSLAMAQRVAPVEPIAQPTPPVVVETPAVPPCESLALAVPSTNQVTITSCTIATGQVCGVGLSVYGITISCTNIFVTPPPVVPDPDPDPTPAPTSIRPTR
jgi:hypothetical protein